MAFLLAILSFLVILCIANQADAITIDPSYIIEVGNENYTTNASMTFSSITYNASWIIFNTTVFDITSANPINITLIKIHSTPTSTSTGEKVYEFYANTTSGSVSFVIGGLKTSHKYNIYKDGVLLTNATTGGVGTLSFTNNVWSRHKFGIYDAYSTPSPPPSPPPPNPPSPPPVGNKPPIADVSAGEPYTGFIGEEITFDASLSLDNDGDIILYEWDFDGDGTYDYNSTEKTKTYIYNVKGEYTVILRVTDDDGASDTDETVVIISQPNRIPSTPDVDGPQDGTQNTEYTYTAVSIDEDNDTIQYHFDWGDGTTNTTEFLPNGTAATQTHIWTVAGKYTISVQAYDNQTPSDITRYTVLIDAHIIGDIGYITDDDADSIYDTFHGKNIETGLGQEDGKYLIDTNGDGEWNYTYDLVDGLATYKRGEDEIPWIMIVVIAIAIAIISIIVYLYKREYF